ncbi:MAG: mechanosensitive ion channel [Bacteroidaceae bacterium]|nr:mechanosensitive ion channel [Bacteroidaceae bacterium]
MTFLQSTPIDPNTVINVNDSIKAVTSNLISQVKEDPNTLLQDLLQSAIDFGLKLLAAIAIYIVGAWLIKRVKIWMGKIFAKRKTEATLSTFINSLVSITLTVLLIIVTIGALGVNTTSLAALLAAGGMAIGMALSGTVSNFAGGLMILVFKPFKAGDFISAQGYSGTVKEVSIVNTKMITPDNREIIIPNGALSNGNIDNYSAKPIRRLDFELNMAYGTDADKCIAAILKILQADARVLDAKTKGASDPMSAVSSLNDSTVTFLARVWVKAADYWPLKFDLNKELFTQLPKQGFTFEYPHMNVTLSK